ncbi:MAG: glycosyltransferase family 4 protein [Planctomycetota bacterium]
MRQPSRPLNRFAYVCGDPGVPIPGHKGASIHVASVCKALRRRGLDGEVHAVCAEGSELHGLPIKPISLPERRKRKSVEEREARLFLASLGSSLSLDARPDFIYERYSLWHAGGLARARDLGIPFVLEVNSPLPIEAQRFRSLANPALAEGLAQVLLWEADAIVCVSEEVAQWVEKRRGHREGVWTIPNGVDPEIFFPNPGVRPPELPQQSPLIAFSGSFRPWHGLDDLLDAVRILAQRIDDVHLVCVGDGPTRLAAEERARDLRIEHRVHFTGQLPHHEVPRWLQGADVLVAPYPVLSDFYFSPLKIFEFLALEIPVVATASGQIPALIPDRERGFLCAPGVPDALATRIEDVIRSPSEARAIAANAREWVLRNATWEARVGDLLQRIGALS